jgi:hypothetical protein
LIGWIGTVCKGGEGRAGAREGDASECAEGVRAVVKGDVATERRRA